MTEERKELYEALAQNCKILKLSQRIVESCHESTTEEMTFLLHLLTGEVKSRRTRRIAQRLASAGFPVLKGLDDYNFGSTRLPQTLSKEALLELSFLKDKENLILYGPVGTGKTHLAIAIGAMACQNDLRVRFYTVAGLVNRLSEAQREGTLTRLTTELSKLDLLILDEWGYVPVDRQGSRLLFRVIGDSYERNSLIVTTNLEFSRWGSIFTDEQMAAAMIDRLVHYGHLILFEGKSYRLTHALMRQGLNNVKEELDDIN